MEYMSATDFNFVRACFLDVLIALATYAWVEIYRMWSSNKLYARPVSGTYQIIKLLGWLVVVIALILCTVSILWWILL